MIAPTSARPGRNEPCHCGSGRKYKQCCLAKDEALDSAARKVAAEAAAAAAIEVPAEGAEVSATPRTAKHQTAQPWRNTTSRGFVPRSTTPRKAGGS